MATDKSGQNLAQVHHLPAPLNPWNIRLDDPDLTEEDLLKVTAWIIEE